MSEILFLKASREKYRFSSSKGLLTIEDLWDLTLQAGGVLDQVAKTLHQQIKTLDEESFITTKSAGNEELSAKLDIVKHIITVKQSEAHAKVKAKQKQQEKAKLLDLLQRKKESALEGKSEQELLDLLAQLDKE